jgi:TRAP-type C4-dicarboxylate transport system permease small subunit
MKFIHRLGGLVGGIMNGMAFLSGVFLIMVMLIITIAVVCRYFLHHPLGWSIEVSQYLLVFLSYLSIAWVLRREGHVKIDIFLFMFSRKTQGLINTLTSACSILVSLIITIFAVKVTWDLYRADYFEPTILMVPKFIFIAVIALGFLMLTIQFSIRSYDFYKRWKSLSNN